ncbi:hypothetical protein EES45_21105 [Streptomyces sp. ADI97-07]|uniref:Uncharacterized protein n=1 Tax=Streptomyces clavifer TaxID=68188 RepID=A0ABS4VAZ3_9ACTN|nr:hypothetical protein [Streptomyces clavifer]RPK77395.1 hypothetical protein EES45_21105 [Streptomyces sp. ADI97-07]
MVKNLTYAAGRARLAFSPGETTAVAAMFRFDH